MDWKTQAIMLLLQSGACVATPQQQVGAMRITPVLCLGYNLPISPMPLPTEPDSASRLWGHPSAGTFNRWKDKKG